MEEDESHGGEQDQLLPSVPVGTTATARCIPLHRGRRTSVWQTTVTGEDGRVAAIVTQTQLVLPGE